MDSTSSVYGTPTSDGGVADLPFSHGKTFYSLDEYLAQLKAGAAIDLPYWLEIRPGVYQWMTSMRPQGEPETATRAELARRYQFER